ncbi:MAG: hypothetical protein U9N76_08255, partial [Candidatus Marinimicrobia bacterium]|nr:hypothetical protein [Candidatus Neomarinimicrobiota bacterium]
MNRKIIVLIFVLLMMVSNVLAKKSVNGEWLLTTVEMEGKKQDVYSMVKFKNDGYAEMDGRVFGSWKQDKKTVEIKSEMVKEFAGKRDIKKCNRKEMVLESKNDKLIFVKLIPKKIKIANQESGFIGIWEMNDNGEKSYFKFSLPDVLEIGSSNYSS